jgi:hypothetical protein
VREFGRNARAELDPVDLAEITAVEHDLRADRSGRVAIDWGVYGVPETYVIGGDGKIAFRHVGPLTEAAIKEKLLPLVQPGVAKPQG